MLQHYFWYPQTSKSANLRKKTRKTVRCKQHLKVPGTLT